MNRDTRALVACWQLFVRNSVVSGLEPGPFGSETSLWPRGHTSCLLSFNRSWTIDLWMTWKNLVVLKQWDVVAGDWGMQIIDSRCLELYVARLPVKSSHVIPWAASLNSALHDSFVMVTIWKNPFTLHYIWYSLGDVQIGCVAIFRCEYSHASKK